MPFTLLHYPFAYGLSRIDKRLNLPALFVGAVIPDIEVPFLFLFFHGVLPDHFILHSLLGALSIGLILAVVITRFIYPTLIGSIFKLDREELTEKCGITPIMILSAMIGMLSHLTVDFLYHWYNPVLWPWVDPFTIVGPFCIFFADLLAKDILIGYFVANILTNSILLLVFVAIILKVKENRWHRLWIGD